MTTLYVQSNVLYLAGSGVIIGATSIVLTDLTDIYGNVLTMSDFGSEGYITLEPDTVNEESATFTGVVANANGTYTLTGVKTTLAKFPYTETSGLVRAHSGGTKVVITDNVAFWNTFTNKHNDETVDGQWTFTNTPIVPGTVSDASTTVKGVSKLSVAAVLSTNPIVVGDNDPRVPTADPTTLFYPLHGRAVFGGTGADGALSITSGTTTIDLGGAREFVKNYSSISITGTGNLAFTNPHANGTIIKLKSTGAVTLTSNSGSVIDMRNLGSAGAAQQSTDNSNGATGTIGTSSLTPPGGGGGGGRGNLGSGGAAGTAGVAGISATAIVYAVTASKMIPFSTGAGGAAGGSGDVNGGITASYGGAGGAGAGSLVIECGGAFNFTTGTILATGTAGSNGGPASTDVGGGGGGGGGGGSVIIMYGSLTANSGTITCTGGAGGTGGVAGSGSSGGGGGGGGGGTSKTGNVGLIGQTSAGGNGGAGGDAFSAVIVNSDF